MLNDPLANTLSKIMNAERLGKSTCEVRPASKMIKQVLTILQDNMFIGGFEEKKDPRGGSLTINLIGKVNKCGVIKPRYSAKVGDFERFEKRYLPAKGFGVLIISTPKGIVTQEESAKNNDGGVLLAYCY